VDTDWQGLPELEHLGLHLYHARRQRGLSQEELARVCELSQAQVSLFESSRRLPSLSQFVRLAQALDVPLQQLLTGTERPGIELSDIVVELRLLGAADLSVVDARVPGAARRPEEVIALAAAGSRPDPRVVETLPALLSWNAIHPAILRGCAMVTRTTNRLAWLTEIALAVDRQKGFPGGCRRAPLERFLKAVKLPPSASTWDDLGRPGERAPASPIWRRWKICYGATMKDFENRAHTLATYRETLKGLQLGDVHDRATAKASHETAAHRKKTSRRRNGAIASRKRGKEGLIGP
jgi:transcriptional regulator with XRE-family HTH domain